ncbi:MAG: hypothetical protein LBU48_00970 [Coriobacteriales bacterium]|jgi:hypothetical protein|nr:hypothetical protein [Coriobacteriales bacterium]
MKRTGERTGLGRGGEAALLRGVRLAQVHGLELLRGSALRFVATLLFAVALLGAGALGLGIPGLGATAAPSITAAFADEPLPSGAKLSLTESSLWEVGAVALGDTETLKGLGITHRVIALISAPGIEDYTVALQISFDTSRVDVHTRGIYPMPALLPEPYRSLENDLANFTVEVFDPAVPRLYSAARGMLSFNISYTYVGTLEALRLWRSDDGGATWRRYWDGATGEQESENIKVELLGARTLGLVFYSPVTELAGEVMLAFEVPALKTGSEILSLNLGADSLHNGIGGDRDGGDRIRLPWQEDILGGGGSGAGAPGSDGSGSAGGSGGTDGSSGVGNGSVGGGRGSAGSRGTGGSGSSGSGSTGSASGAAGLILSPLAELAPGANATTLAENANNNAAQAPTRSANGGSSALASEPSQLDAAATGMNTSDGELIPVLSVSLTSLISTFLLTATAITFARRQRGHDLLGS